jgi:hypothetical protein
VKTSPKPRATAAKTPKKARKPAPARKAAPKKSAPARKAARERSSPARKSAPAKKSARAAVAARRADFGAPIDGFFAKQAPHLRVILEELRKLVEEGAPDAIASIKWGMPNYAIGRAMVCALAGFKSHVNLILAGPPGAFADPDGLLEGEAKGGRHLKLRALEELPREATLAWVRAAAQFARNKS